MEYIPDYIGIIANSRRVPVLSDGVFLAPHYSGASPEWCLKGLGLGMLGLGLTGICLDLGEPNGK